MFIAVHFATGIIATHLAWVAFFLMGTLVWTPTFLGSRRRRPAAQSEALLELVVVTATGMAIAGFATFVLGMCRLLSPAAAITVLALMLVAFHAMGDSPVTARFWSERVALLRAAATPWSVGLYAVLLFAALPAVLPPTSFDPLFYHFTYALDWAREDRIFTDDSLRFPYYANNWLLLETWFVSFGRANSLQFMGWFAGALSVFGVFGLVETLAARWFSDRRQIRFAALLASCSLLFAPVFLRWLDEGMNDSPLGFFYFVSVASVSMAIATRERRWAYYAIAVFGFYIGMKSIFLVFLPAGAIGVWLAMRATGAAPRKAAVGVAIIVVLALPWYVRNIVATGDPFPPLLGLVLHRPEPNWTATDIALQANDLRGNESPVFLLEMPVDMLLHPTSQEYREFGVTVVMLLAQAPGIVLIYGLIRRRGNVVTPGFILCAYLAYAVLFWLVSSHLVRYALLFYPSLAAFVALGVLRVAAVGGSRFPAPAALASLAVMALPAPAGVSFLSSLWQSDYLHIGELYTNNNAYLGKFLTAYPEEEYVSRRFKMTGVASPRVYIMGDDTLRFYFKSHGVTKIGDWFNEGRYSDFVAAIDRGSAAAFLARLHVDAFMMSEHPLLTPVRIAHLDEELVRAGYEKKVLPGGTTAMYFAPWAQ